MTHVLPPSCFIVWLFHCVGMEALFRAKSCGSHKLLRSGMLLCLRFLSPRSPSLRRGAVRQQPEALPPPRLDWRPLQAPSAKRPAWRKQTKKKKTFAFFICGPCRGKEAIAKANKRKVHSFSFSRLRTLILIPKRGFRQNWANATCIGRGVLRNPVCGGGAPVLPWGLRGVACSACVSCCRWRAWEGGKSFFFFPFFGIFGASFKRSVGGARRAPLLAPSSGGGVLVHGQQRRKRL